MDPPQSTSPLSKARRRAQKAQNATSSGPLQLPSLPRFHPAAYNSNSSSMSTTPNSSGASPQPMSPRAQQRASEAQRQLAHYQQHLISQYMSRDGATTPIMGQKPPSPKLIPLAGSPGAVTPLELEGDNYLTAGAGQSNLLSVESIMRSELRKRESLSPRRQQVPTA